MGAFLGPCLVMLAVFVMDKRPARDRHVNVTLFKQRWQTWSIFVVVALGVLLSNSQAILAGVVATLLWAAARGLVRRLRIIQLIGVVIGATLAAGTILRAYGIDFIAVFSYRFEFLIKNIIDPENTGQITSYANRSERMLAGLDIWYTHPLLGVGLGNTGYHTTVHEWTNSPWIQLLAEQGLLGALMLVLVFATSFYALSRAWRRLPRHSDWHPVVTAMLFLIVLTAADGFFTLNWTHPQRVFTLALASWVAFHANRFVMLNRRAQGLAQQRESQQRLAHGMSL